MRKLRVIVLLMLTSCSFTGFAQTVLADSLRLSVYAAKTPEDKLKALINMFEEYHSINRDTLDRYGPEVKELAAASKNQRLRSLAELAYANWYYRWGWSDSSLVFIEPEIARNAADDPATRDIYFKLTRAKAMYLGSKSRFAEALDVLYGILPKAEQYKDTLTIGLACNTIGSIAIARQHPDEALKWINRSILVAGNKNSYLNVLAPAYINAGYAFASLGKMDSAAYFINTGLPVCRQIQNLNYVATALRIQTNIYTNTKQYNLAEKALLEMISIRKQLAPANIFVEENLQLADFYASTGQIEKAIELCKVNLQRGSLTGGTGEGTTTFTNDPKQRVTFLERLSGYYKQAGRLNEYQLTLEELVGAKDSLYAANSAEVIAELQTKYEVQKKENTILQQKYDLQRKNFLFYGSIVLTTILLLSGTAMFRRYRKKQKAKVERMMEEERRQAEEAIKKAEEKERVRIASDLHDNLGAYAASMASNLSYIHFPEAGEITNNALKQLTNNSNAIISQLNDTIWALKKEELSLTAISDRIKNFISRLRKSYPDVNIEVLENITVDHRLPSSQAFHLYRIMQEAINNALKHSGGQNILINITGANTWEIIIADDGKGFNVKEVNSNTGNGLSNIMERSREAGWVVRWERSIPQGIAIKITATTN